MSSTARLILSFCAVGGMVGAVPDSLAAERDYTLLVSTPPNVDREVVSWAAATAFNGRGWTVKSQSEDHVTGYLNHRGIEATLELKILDGKIDYYCDCVKRVRARRVGVRRTPRKEKSEIRPYTPEGWIHNIRKDITKNLRNQAVSARRSNAKLQGPSAKQRLRSLQTLLDDGLVTQEEYDSKRAEIISDM